MLLEDGRGRNGNAGVTKDQRAETDSKVHSRMFYISRDEGLAFNAIMPGFSPADGNNVFYLKNTSSDHNLFVNHLEFHSVLAVLWKIYSCTGTQTGGTSITPVNMNLGSGRLATATSMGGGANITGLTTTAQIGTHRTQAGGESEMDWDGALILGPNDAIVVQYVGTAGLCEVDCLFHFEPLQ